MMERRKIQRSWCLATAVVVTAAAFYAATVPRRFDFDSDHAQYAGLATSLARGAGYVFDGHFDVKYPPGYPSLLVLVSLASRGSYAAMAVATGLIGAIAIGLVFLYVRERDGTLAIAVTIAIAASAAYYALVSAGVASDTPYIAATAAFLLWTERRWSDDMDRSVAFMLVGALVLAFAVLVRTVGVSLVVGLGLTLAYRRVVHRQGPSIGDLAVLATGIAAFGGWVALQALNRHPLYAGQYNDSYVRQLLMADPHTVGSGMLTVGGALRRAMFMVPVRLAGIAEILANVGWVKARWFSPAIVGALAFAGIGVVRDLRRRVPVAGWYLLSYLGILALWPFSELRFLVDVEFLLFLFAFTGIQAVYAEMTERPGRTATMILGMAVAGIALGLGTWLRDRASWSFQDTASMMVWVAAATFAVIMKRVPSVRPMLLPSRRAGVVVASVYLLLGLVQIAPIARSNMDGSLPPWMAVRARASAWLTVHSPANAVIMTTWDAALHYATGRSTVPLPLSVSRPVMRDAVARLDPQFVVVFDSTTTGGQYFRPGDPDRFLILERVAPNHFTLVHTFPGGRIYAVTHDGEGPLR